MKQLSKGFKISIVLALAIIAGCQPKAVTEEATGSVVVSSGDIIISNQGADTVLLFDSNGVFKSVLYEITTVNGEALTGISENTITGEILLLLMGLPIE